MSDVYVLGVDMIKFGRFPDRTVPNIGAEAALMALDDAGLTIKDMQAMFVAAYFHFPNGWNADAGGYEMAATYIVILAIPLIYGGGKYLSLDYWVRRN